MASNAGGEVFPGSTGLVIHEQDGVRDLAAMTWGWPMKFKTMSATAKPKAVNNIAELTKWLWNEVAKRPGARCLIPLTAFAEAEGEKGAKTRTWFNVKGKPIFAWASLWQKDRKYDWGLVYSGLMTDCNEAIRPIHNRMPVLLLPHEYDLWLHGSFEDALAMKDRRFPDELIEITRTEELWDARKRNAQSSTPTSSDQPFCSSAVRTKT
jgi:putative SOS response-associated peptidase YedK